MMAMIVSFVSGTLGKALLGGGIFLAAWLFVKVKYENQGAARERAKIEHAGVRNATKAAQVRRAVDALPDDRLRDRYFRD